MKIRIYYKMFNAWVENKVLNHLLQLVEKQREVIDEILIEPYGSVRYEVLKLHMTVLDLKIIMMRGIFKIK